MTTNFELDTASATTKILFHIGRMGLASLFVLGGIDKITDPGPALVMMQDVGLPLPEALIWAVIAVELGLGLLVATGWRWVVPAALALAVHTLATNVLFHDFWMMEGNCARLELSLFFKNIAVMGGLLMVAGLYGSRKAM